MSSSSGSGENLQQLMDQKKIKRMQSNRESARRSRMKKQKHLDDLSAEVARTAMENDQILSAIGVAKHHFTVMEAENSVLRAHMMELVQRLKSLNEILDLTNSAGGGCMFEAAEFQRQGSAMVSETICGP